MASNKLDLTKNVQRIAAKQSPKDDRAPTIDYPISTRAADTVLPAEAGVLSERLQEIARQYIGARQRSGEALLEAARWLSEARAEAQHGEWRVFLEATNTSDDTAERLLNIHRQAMQNPQFAESIRVNWLGQSVAALLAQPSTPPEIVAEVLDSPEPPTVVGVRKKISQGRQKSAGPQPARDLGEAQNPQIADFDGASENPSVRVVEAPTAEHLLRMLQDAAVLLQAIASIANAIPATRAADQSMILIEQAVETIRQVLPRQTNDEA
jgi:hypothetical protein